MANFNINFGSFLVTAHQGSKRCATKFIQWLIWRQRWPALRCVCLNNQDLKHYISNVPSFSCRMPINFCSQCGEKLQATFKFCPSCGEKLPCLPLAASPAPAGQTASRSDGTTLDKSPVQAPKRKSKSWRHLCAFLCLVIQGTYTCGAELWVTWVMFLRRPGSG